MNQKDIIDFFDRLAPMWDDDMIINTHVVNKILDHAGVTQGKKVLDVACGTGVMVPFYLERGASVVGVDISAKMIEIATKKFGQPQVAFVCDDVQKADLPRDFDCAVVYNAFPHFESPCDLAFALADKLKTGGRVTIAHGMSRKWIDSHHKQVPSSVSNPLISEEELAQILSKHFDVDIVISDDEKYIVSGVKK